MELDIDTADTISNNITTDNPLDLIEKFVSAAKLAQQNLSAWEQAFDAKLTATENFVDAQIQQIQTTLTHFQKTLQATSAQEWRVTPQTLCQEGREQIHALQETYFDIKKSAKEITTRFDRVSTQITKNLNNSLQGLHPMELQNLADDSREEIKLVTASATEKMSTIVHWFHWKNILLVLFLTLVVTLLVTLYIDDEWPWEQHKTVSKQRLAGQILMTAWPQLSHSIQRQIMDDVA